METVEDAVIVGAGIAGLATAVALKQIGVRALVLERSEGLRATGAALTLFPNAWRALDALGVSHKLTPLYQPAIKSLVTEVGTGNVKEVYYLRPHGSGPRPVHRKALLEALAQELPVDSIRFSSKVVVIDQIQERRGASIVIVHLEDGTTIKSKVLIGCDGVHSVVARWLGLASPVYLGRSAVRGLAVFPQGHGHNQEIHQFVDVGKRGGFVALNEKEAYCFLTCRVAQGQNLTRDPNQIQREVLEHHARDFPTLYLDAVRHADMLSLSWAPLMLRYPWAVAFGNLSKGNVTVAGDAMHPMPPSLAQGGASALEDAVVLGRHIGNHLIKNGTLVAGDLMAGALDGYVKERRWRTAGLILKSYLSGLVQNDGSNWWMRFLRDSIFYKYLDAFFASAVTFDCGELPLVPCGEVDLQSNKNE